VNPRVCWAVLAGLFCAVGLSPYGSSVAAELDGKKSRVAKILQDRWGDTGVGSMMGWVEPGQFLLGSWKGDSERDADESPRARINITGGFYVGLTETTRARSLKKH
jgi:hypothetical protein